MAVWQNPNISSICSQMPNMTILMANAAAAMGRTQLSSNDRKLLQQYARETHADYCAGCTAICESAITGDVPVGKVMRYLMYSRSYGEHDHACRRFRNIAPSIRRQMAGLDYSLAEQRCPQKMPIGRLMREAGEELS
jgi:predicted aldo/keto reductase-like oxidoreductase